MYQIITAEINLSQLMTIIMSVYWILIIFSIGGILIDWGIKIKNNEEGSEGKDKINKTIRGRFFGITILVILGIIGSGLIIGLVS